MFRKGFVLVGISLFAALGLSGCGGGSGSSGNTGSTGGSGGPAPLSVAVTASAATVDGTDQVTLTATVTNDQQSGGVTWSVSGGGTLSNSTTTSATFTAPEATASAQSVTVTATAVRDASKSGTILITVPAAPAVSTNSSALAGTAGTNYSVQLTGSGGISPYTWTVASGYTLPAGLSLSAAGVISGLPLAAGVGTTNVAIVMKDSGTPTAMTVTQALGITIAAGPAITFTGVMPATGTQNLAYAGSAAASGGIGTLTYSLNSGALPTGLNLNAASGAVTGTTTQAGTYNFAIKATDAIGDSANQGYQIVVGYPAVTIAPGTGSLAIAVTGQTYSQTLTASGGSGAGYVWTVSGLSNGLTSSASGGTLTISGPAATAGPVNFTAMVKDGAGDSSGTASYSIQVYSPVTLPSTIPATLPSTAPLNWAYSGTVAASGGSGDDTWTVTGLSDGLSTSSSGFTLTVSGTPTSPGTVTLNVSVKDTITGVTAGPYAYTITVPNAVTLPAPNPSTLGPAALSTSYTGTIVAAGGSGNYSWTVTDLPADSLNYSSSGGVLTISGTPGTTGPVSFGVSVKDTTTNTTVGPYTYTVTVYNPLTLPTPNPASLPLTATVNSAYSGTLTASGGSGSGYTYTVTGLPTNGLVYSSSGGVLIFNGTPVTTAPIPFSVSVKDSLGFKAGPVTYTITPYNTVTLPAPNPVTLGPAVVSTPYTGSIVAAGGSGNYTWTVTGLPADSLSYSASGATLTISGTPSTIGPVSFGVTIKDNTTNLSVGPYSYAVMVYNPLTLPTPNPASLPATATVNAAYTGTIAASGGSGSGYTWTVSGLPANGLTYSSNGGVLTISGTPATTTAVSFAVSVKDSAGFKAGPLTYTVTAYNTATLPAPNPASLGSADAGSAYTGTIAVVGGSGNYSWTVTGLPADSLNYSANGATLTISGTPASAGTVSFNVSVKDNTTNTTVGPYTYSITVYSALALPAPNPTSLPAGYTSVPYTGTIGGSGGSGNYSWQVTGLYDNLSATPSGTILTISGTPGSTAATVTFNITLTDTATNISISQTGYSVAISVPPPVVLPAPNAALLPVAIVNELYAGSINASGGVSPFTWSVNGVSIPNTGAAVPVADGILVSNNGNNILNFGGTPATAQTVPLTNVKVTDSIGSTQTKSYSIVVSNISKVSGQIFLNPTCGGGSASVPTITLNLLTNPGGTIYQTVTTDSSGNFIFGGIPDGNYTITPSITGPSSVFYPATLPATVNESDVSGENFNVALGYTVSGTASYGGSNTGQIYLALVPSSNCGAGETGTSISTPGAFTIRGVPPGTYTLQAWMDLAALANGAQNTSDPSGSTAATVSAANVTGAAVALTDNTPVSVPGANPAINAISPTDQGVAISFNAVTINGVEAATSYDVQWSTSPAFSSSTAIYSFKASGIGSNVWILNNGTSGLSGSPFTNGQTYYFEARARNAAGPASGWTVYGGATPIGVTIGASTSGNQVQGTVTIPAGLTPTGPLYVGYYNQSTNTVYTTRIASPGASNPFTVYVPTDAGNDYFFFEILDQNNDGLVDAGDVTNTNNNNSSGISISGPLTGQNLTLSTANSTAVTAAMYYQNTIDDSGTAITLDGYNLSFDIREGNKLPVAVTLMSGPNVINPVDISNYCQICGSVQFQYFVGINSNLPAIGDTYSFKVTYSDASTETLTGSIAGWNGTALVVGSSHVPTNLAPGFVSNLRPNFSWIDPALDSTDLYSFYLTDSNGNSIWQVPGSNSRSSGFPASITSLDWGVDPTNSSNDLASGTFLTDQVQYMWQIQAQDNKGNQAQAAVYIMASGLL